MFLLFFIGILVSMHVGVEDILIVAFFPFIILAAAHNDTGIKKALDTIVLQRLGDWSFSIYMVHVPIMFIFWIFQVRSNPTLYAKFPPESARPPDYMLGLIVCLVIVVSTLFLAALSYRYIEVPARSYLNGKFRPTNNESVTLAN